MSAAPKLNEAQVREMAFGQVIAGLREQRGWTQGKLAEAVGIAQSALSRLESGKGTLDVFVVQRLAAQFGMTIEQLDARVQQALQVAQNAARAAPAMASKETEPNWWGVLGFVAGGALVTFAVATVIEAATSSGK